MYIYNGEEGNIYISRVVIGRILENVILQFEGKVFISNHKGKISKRNLRNGFADDMEITFKNNETDIKVYIIINFGTSIAKVTNAIIEEAQEKIKKYTGIEVNSISLIVKGMQSKQIAKRNIEVKG